MNTLAKNILNTRATEYAQKLNKKVSDVDIMLNGQYIDIYVTIPDNESFIDPHIKGQIKDPSALAIMLLFELGINEDIIASKTETFLIEYLNYLFEKFIKPELKRVLQ